jgi:hypothetical protein
MLVSRVVLLGGKPLHAYTLVNVSKTYPVLHVGQLVDLLGGVVLAYFARFHLNRVLVDSVRHWQRYLMLFLAALGLFALREILELPMAVSYPNLTTQSAYMAVFDLVFAGAGLLIGLTLIRFQERE